MGVSAVLTADDADVGNHEIVELQEREVADADLVPAIFSCVSCLSWFGVAADGSDEGLAVLAPERMVARAFNRFILTGDRQSDRAGRLVQEGARDDSANVAVSLRRDEPLRVNVVREKRWPFGTSA